MLTFYIIVYHIFYSMFRFSSCYCDRHHFGDFHRFMFAWICLIVQKVMLNRQGSLTQTTLPPPPTHPTNAPPTRKLNMDPPPYPPYKCSTDQEA